MHAYLEKSKLESEEIEIIKKRALKAQEEFEALERKQNENKELHDRMKEEIKKMDQAVVDSSSFIKKMKDKDPQQIAYEKTISDFWGASDVLQESAPVKIAPYPSLESLNEEPKDKLTKSNYEYYDKKRKIFVEKMAIAMMSIWPIYRIMIRRILRIRVKSSCISSVKWVIGSTKSSILWRKG